MVQQYPLGQISCTLDFTVSTKFPGSHSSPSSPSFPSHHHSPPSCPSPPQCHPFLLLILLFPLLLLVAPPLLLALPYLSPPSPQPLLSSCPPPSRPFPPPYLPEVKSNVAKVLIHVQVRVFCVLRVGDLWVLPLTLVVGVINLTWLPLSLWRCRMCVYVNVCNACMDVGCMGVGCVGVWCGCGVCVGVGCMGVGCVGVGCMGVGCVGVYMWSRAGTILVSFPDPQ